MIRAQAAKYGDKLAFHDERCRMSYRALSRGADEVARALIVAGVGVGDRVALWAPNSADWLVSAAGVLTAGAALVPLNTRFKGDEAAFTLCKSRARMLITVDHFLGVDFLSLIADHNLSELELRLSMASASGGPMDDWFKFLEQGRACDARAVDERLAELAGDAIADITFTSGTTGEPKGAVITHAQTLRGFFDTGERFTIGENDSHLLVLPMFHSYGYKVGTLACLMRGASVHSMAAFEPERALRIIESERVTLLTGPPTVYSSMLDHPAFSSVDVSSVRAAMVGSTSVSAVMFERIHREFDLDGLTAGYGLTENSGIGTLFPLGAPFELVASTVGPAMPGVRVRVVDLDTGRDAAVNTNGEILLAGHAVMKGYFEDPEKTAAVIDADGWLHTGDLGAFDVDGNLSVTGRLKDMYIVGGFNVYPAEIENILVRHPNIAEVAVVGVPDQRLGEVGAAFVIPVAGSEVKPPDVIAWAKAMMANYKVPRHVRVVEELPLTPNGKVMKFVLREQFIAAEETMLTTITDA